MGQPKIIPQLDPIARALLATDLFAAREPLPSLRNAFKLTAQDIADFVTVAATPANNGLIQGAGAIQLGQPVGTVGDLAKMLHTSEIPLNGFGLILRDVGSVAGAQLIFRKDVNADANFQPEFIIEDSAGTIISTFRSYIPASPNLSLILTNNGAPSLVGRGNFVFGTNAALNATVARDSVFIGAQTGLGITNSEKSNIIGSDCFDLLGVVSVGSDNVAFGSNIFDDGVSHAMGNGNVFIGARHGNFAADGVVGDNNIVIGHGNFISKAFPGTQNKTIIIGNGIFTDVSNIIILGDATQNVLIGSTSPQVDNGNRLQVTGKLNTGGAAPLTLGAGAMDFGKVVNAASVLNATKYLEISVDGVLVKVCIN